MFENFKSKIMASRIAMVCLFVAASAGAVSASIDFSAITDLLNVTFQVLNIVVANTTTLVNVVVLFGTLGLVGIIIYGFIGRLLHRIASMGGSMGDKE